jgi:hypothetical protein
VWRSRWDSLTLFTSARYVDAPVFSDDGAVIHTRGVTAAPGLYFLGMPWQHTRGSALLGSVKDDAHHIADRISKLATVPADTPDARLPLIAPAERNSSR